ncbi:hypothetical protein EZV62_002069 [Acer yangbiense]|uniref:Uncharacterized protein n=1 Tax=Acer yangbiense TaxID=1000413 RepID=A0A5C7IW13_9ROSI|nr:hypothetical protein EZV62_002069 [Acer yangbiense]
MRRMILRSSITCLICYENVAYHLPNVSFRQLNLEDGAINISMLPILIALDNVRQRFIYFVIFMCDYGCCCNLPFLSHIEFAKADEEYEGDAQDDHQHRDGHLLPKDAKEASKLVTMDVGRFFFENEIPFNVAASPSFATMCRSLGDYDRGYKVPSPYNLSTYALQKKVETTNKIVKDVKRHGKQLE